MRLLLAATLTALLAAGPAAAGPGSNLREDLEAAPGESARIRLVRDAWEDLGPRARLHALQALGEDAGDATERYLVELLKASENAFLRRRAALLLGHFATRKDTLEVLEAMAEHDEETALDSGSCWRTQGHARKEAGVAAERVRERREAIVALEDDTSLGQVEPQSLSWFGTDL